jgi:VIT1/CCC1 family predicted Fe2+/Mn2+ transporter
MKDGLRDGLNFGLTSGVITTLGLMVGLYAGTASFLAVVGGIITIAFADALSDAMGIHLAKEGDNSSSAADVWAATVATFVSKALMTLTFLVPLLIFNLPMGLWVGVGWGMLVLSLLSYQIARSQQTSALPVIAEHLAIAIAVVLITHWLGLWVNSRFG